MATLLTNPPLVRLRPGRVLAGAKPSTIPSTTSHVSLFLTNLRLLDLDLLPDWPDISSHVFSQKDTAGQGQKKRIQCVEWALYQLFALWDPEETRNVRCSSLLHVWRDRLLTVCATRSCSPSSHRKTTCSPSIFEQLSFVL